MAKRASGLGSFAQGLSQGILDAQRMRTNRERNQALGEQRRDREGGRAALEELSAVDLENPDSVSRSVHGTEDVVGPPQLGTVDQVMKRARSKADSILDPAINKRVHEGIAAKVMPIATKYMAEAGAALDNGNAEQAERALNEASKLFGQPAGYNFSLNKKGEVVSDNGTVITRNHLLAAHQSFMDDGIGALQTMIGASDKAKKQALEERKTAAIEARNTITGEYYKKVSAHYERADAVDLLKELNDAAGGAVGYKPVDIDRTREAVRDIISNDTGMTGIVNQYSGQDLGGMANAIALHNGSITGQMTEETAVGLATQLWYNMNGSTNPELMEELGDVTAADFNIRPPMAPGGNFLVEEAGSGVVFKVPSMFLQEYYSAQQAAAAAAEPKPREPSIPPLYPDATSPPTVANRAPLARGRRGPAIDLSDMVTPQPQRNPRSRD